MMQGLAAEWERAPKAGDGNAREAEGDGQRDKRGLGSTCQ
jgi:hypothetical protein